MIRAGLFLLALSAPAAAEIVVPTRTIPARSVIEATDLVTDARVVPGAVSVAEDIIGLEARVALYAGRPIRPEDVALPAIVERNQIVALIFESGVVRITTEGRALGRGGPGDVIEVMNVASRQTVMARVGIDGGLYVSQ